MKKAIVIGATSGIGRELSLLLASRNYLTGITGRRMKLLEGLQTEMPEKFVISSFDLTDTGNIAIHLNELITQLGGVDILILCSGDGLLNENLDYTIQKPIIDLNIIAFTIIINYAFNFFKEQGYGQFCAITSIAGLRGNSQSINYSATKAYQINYLQGLNQKITKSKLPIYVTDARPGFVDTAMAKGDGMFWIAPAKEAALQILEAINKKQKVVYITKRWRLIAIIIKLLPKFIYNKL